jgi:Heterokaryon incompatibility protein (HET)
MSIPYQYSALKEEAGKIRLLTLLPGKARDPTEILLEMIPLTDVSTPKYEALSYVWGPTENPDNIIIQSEHSLSVTSNLADALPSFDTRIDQECYGSMQSVSTKEILESDLARLNAWLTSTPRLRG